MAAFFFSLNFLQSSAQPVTDALTVVSVDPQLEHERVVSDGEHVHQLRLGRLLLLRRLGHPVRVGRLFLPLFCVICDTYCFYVVFRTVVRGLTT